MIANLGLFFVVQICTTPSCTSTDFKKNGRKVLCKLIIFILVVVLGVCQEISKESRYIGDDDLKIIFSKQVSHSFLLPPKKVLRKKQTRSEGNTSQASRIQQATKNKITSRRSKKFKMPRKEL